MKPHFGGCCGFGLHFLCVNLSLHFLVGCLPQILYCRQLRRRRQVTQRKKKLDLVYLEKLITVFCSIIANVYGWLE